MKKSGSNPPWRRQNPNPGHLGHSLHHMAQDWSRAWHLQLTIEQYRFELCQSTYTWILSINTANVFSLLYKFLNNNFCFLDYFTVTIKYIIFITNKICVNQMFMSLIRLPVNRRLLTVKFWGVKMYI